jgi:hypothetical protein
VWIYWERYDPRTDADVHARHDRLALPLGLAQVAALVSPRADRVVALRPLSQGRQGRGEEEPMTTSEMRIQAKAAKELLAEPRMVRFATGAKAAPTKLSFKEGSHLTCRHGRFWRSCRRCPVEK